MLWPSPPQIEFPENECFLNTLNAMRAYNRGAKQGKENERLVCVQGLKIGQEMVLHGWNSRSVADSLAIDVSWYALGSWAFYLGIPFTEEEYWRIRKLLDSDGGVLCVFSKEIFPRVEKTIFSILGNRYDAHKKVA